MNTHVPFAAGGRRFFTVVFAAAAAAGLFAATPSHAALQQLHGHVPAAVAHLTAIGRLPATQSLNLVIGLPLRNAESLNETLRSLYDPTKPAYHHWLTPDQFHAQFGPTEADYQKVVEFARANGLKVTALDPRRRLLNVTAPVAGIEKAFHIHLRTYQHPTEARRFYAPDTEPSVDAGVPILSIANLNDYYLPKPCSAKFPLGAAHSPRTPQPLNGSGPNGDYAGNDFRKAYIPGVGSYYNGAGQYVGLFEFKENFYQSDVTQYETLCSLPSVPVTAIYLDEYDGVIGTNDDGEAALDIDVSIAMAPGLAGVRVYEGAYIDSILQAMANDSYVKQLSASWSTDKDASSDGFLLQMAAQGQSFFISSGDDDAFTGSIPTANQDVNLTVVGGTELTTDSSQNYVSETVWNPGTTNSSGNYLGSGGGIGSVAIPSWQSTNVSFSSNSGSSTLRNTPDVSLVAQGVLAVFNGANHSYQGTSCSSPLWAGLMAVANQAAVDADNPTAGFINPFIYSLYAGYEPRTSYASGFNDIIQGNNAWPKSSGEFNAVAGYDLATGIGTAKSGLVYALSGTDNTTIWANDPNGNLSNNGTYPSPFPLQYALTLMSSQPASAGGKIVLENKSSTPGARKIAFPVNIRAVGGTASIGP